MRTKPATAAPTKFGAHARTFLRSSAGIGAGLVARATAGLLLNKLVALYGGPGGLTQLAQFQNLMGLFTALPADGVQVGATTYLAPLRPGQPRYRLWLGAACWLTAGLVAGSGVLLAVLGGPAWPVGRTLFFTGAMLLVAIRALLGAALLAAGRRRAYLALAMGLSALGPAAVAALLAAHQPLGRVLLGYVAGQALTVGLAVGLAGRGGLLRGWRQPRWPSPVALRGLLKFLLVASGSLLFDRAVDYALRAYLIAHYQPATTDLWQTVNKLSDSYVLVVGALLSAVFYPRLAALAPVPAEQRRYVSSVAGLLAGGLALALGAVFLLRSWLLALLFAPRLAAAGALLVPQMLGDWARLVSWVFQYVLLVRARPGAYLAWQAFAAVLYVGLVAGLLPAAGMWGLVLAHALHHGALLVLCVGWFYGGYFKSKLRFF